MGAAAENLHWFRKWDTILEWNQPHAKWFVGGTTNVAYNCLDRHLETWRKNKAAFIWEGEPGEIRTITYQQLHTEVCKFSNVLKKLGIEKGDRVALYMPLVPELAIAMLACARIGAVHSIIFGGFSAEAIRDRVNDGGCKLIVTADGGYRRGSVIELKKAVDEAVKNCPTVKNVVVYQRTNSKVSMNPGLDHWWHELMQTVDANCPAEELDSEHPLFILYTSGTTGKPKGILHTTGGYLTARASSPPNGFLILKTMIFIGVPPMSAGSRGTSYVVYGPLANGATSFMYEGAPNLPDLTVLGHHRGHKVTIFYTAPTAIRAFIKWGDQHPEKHDLSSLTICSAPSASRSIPKHGCGITKSSAASKCPIVDTWWQTETGGIMITPLPGAHRPYPEPQRVRFRGSMPIFVDQRGQASCERTKADILLSQDHVRRCCAPFGATTNATKTLLVGNPGMYIAGDGARRDKRGNFWIIGRLDDVLNVSGHRLGTAEVESALVSHEAVAEAAVVGRPHDLKGQAISAFVTLEGTYHASDALKEELRGHVAKEIGALAKPDDIRFTDSLPKTRSGKIMRRLLRELASTGNVAGDVTTLEDFSVLEKLREDEE